MLDRSPFPDPRLAPEHGLLAIGGDFGPRFLLTAYANGIFPWPNPGIEHGWYSPDPRLVLLPQRLRVPRSLRKLSRKGIFELRWDTAFEAVIRSCAAVPRAEGNGTWITEEMIDGYCALHQLGFAHSIECWRRGRLVGGLYGVSLGAMFSGESMFYTEPNASKLALVALAENLRRWRFRFIDCQVTTDNLLRFGAEEWPRDRFLDELDQALEVPTRQGPWGPVAQSFSTGRSHHLAR